MQGKCIDQSKNPQTNELMWIVFELVYFQVFQSKFKFIYLKLNKFVHVSVVTTENK